MQSGLCYKLIVSNEQAVSTRAEWSAPDATPRGHVALGLAFSFVRLPLMALAAAATLGLLAALGEPVAFPPSPMIATLYLIPVNVATLLLLRAALHYEGRTLRGLIGFSRSRLPRDCLWGLFWLIVLYVPFALAILGAMLLLYGGDAFARFETVFVPARDSMPDLSAATGIVLGAVAVLMFAPLNAPAEELAYRGFAQGHLQRAWPRAAAVLVPAAGFGVQHLFFAPTAPAMVVYGLAFFVWGAGCGLIYLRQRRLMPLIVCHFIVNLLTSAPALVLPLLLPA